MMYSEFIEISGKSENYISHNEYATYIEPIYNDCELSKKEFISLIQEAFEKIVYPAVEKCIHNLTMSDKFSMISGDCPGVMRTVENTDFTARKIAYEYCKMFSVLQ